MSEFSFTKAERLSGERRIARLFDEGAGGFVWPFRYVWLAVQVGEEGSEAEVAAEADASEKPKRACPIFTQAGVSVLVSVSKRNHKMAVARNLLKRRTREAYRLNKSGLLGAAVEKNRCVALGLVYASKDKTDFQTIENAVRKILGTVARHL